MTTKIAINEPGQQVRVKADARGPNGRRFLLLGLTDANIAWLKQGNPIGIDMEDLGYPGVPQKVIFTYGTNDDAAVKAVNNVSILSIDVDVIKAPKA